MTHDEQTIPHCTGDRGRRRDGCDFDPGRTRSAGAGGIVPTAGPRRRDADRRWARRAGPQQCGPDSRRSRRKGGNRRIPDGAGRLRSDLHRGDDGAARPLGHARPPDVQRPSERRLLVQIRLAIREGHDAGRRRANADGRCHERPRPCRASRDDSCRQETNRGRRDPRAHTLRRRARADREPNGQADPAIPGDSRRRRRASQDEAADRRWGGRGQDLQPRTDVARRAPGDRRRGPSPRTEGRRPRHHRPGHPARTRVRRGRLSAFRRRRPGVPCRHRRRDPRAGENGSAAVLDADRRRQWPAQPAVSGDAPGVR